MSSSTTRPAYPQYQTRSSTANSSYQSNTSSVASTSSQQSPNMSSARQQPQAAPLSSSSTTSHHYASMYLQTQQPQSQTSALRTQYTPERALSSQTASETGTYLSQYNLVAEAARRAQMAVLARDLDAMEF